MTCGKDAIHLLDTECNEMVEGELWHEITEKQLTDWVHLWKPAASNALFENNNNDIASQNHNWNWQEIAEAYRGLLAYSNFSVMHNNITQGMMVLDTVSYRGKELTQTGKDLIYIKFLETAPWNRKEIQQPQFRGIGCILIGVAINLSLEQGFKGRIGLHALPKTESWYRDICGMSDLGPDNFMQNLRYFEMTPTQANAFLNRGY